MNLIFFLWVGLPAFISLNFPTQSFAAEACFFDDLLKQVSNAKPGEIKGKIKKTEVTSNCLKEVDLALKACKAFRTPFNQFKMEEGDLRITDDPAKALSAAQLGLINSLKEFEKVCENSRNSCVTTCQRASTANLDLAKKLSVKEDDIIFANGNLQKTDEAKVYCEGKLKKLQGIHQCLILENTPEQVLPKSEDGSRSG